jgi:4-amino-4-deoxy-L-arabinose transferase-like glycosyltransferase
VEKSRIHRWKSEIRAFGWLALAAVLLAGPFNRAGLWEPFEFRFAELSRRLSFQLFSANVRFAEGEVLKSVTQGQLPHGELPFTSSAFCFSLLGPSDFAARLPSLFYGLLGAISLWVLLGRFESKKAQIWGVLALVSIPSFVWQSRMMLGDAATMGCLSLATLGLSVACFDSKTRLSTVLWAALGSIGLIAGVFCRGVIVGVFIPATAVGIAGLRQWRAADGSRRSIAKATIFPGILLALGLGVFAFGAKELAFASNGYSRLLGAVLSGPYSGGNFADGVTALAHALFPWSAFLPAAIAWAILPRETSPENTSQKSALATTWVLMLVLTFVAMGASAYRLISMPFPTVTAVAGLIGIGIARGQKAKSLVVSTAMSVALIGILVYADYVNIPEKWWTMAGVFAQKLPEGSASERSHWLTVTLGVMILACGIATIGRYRAFVPPFSRERRIAFFERARETLSGHFLSGLVLFETMLMTTGLMVHAHERQFIYVPLFDSRVPGLITGLKFLWLLPLVVVIVVPIGFVLILETANFLLTAKFPWISLNDESTQEQTNKALRSVIRRVRLDPMSVVAIGLWLGATLITWGEIPRSSEQLSIKPVLRRFEQVAKPNEPLVLLGMNRTLARYYLKRTPESYYDIGLSARWLAEAKNERRYVAFRRQELAEVNAAFRAESKGNNLFIYAPNDGAILLARNGVGKNEINHNPLMLALPASVPSVSHTVVGTFGDAITAIGWEFRDRKGQALRDVVIQSGLTLRLVFKVIDTPRNDWQLFVHVDGKGRRQNLDHEPVEGNFPTDLWQPGDIIVDDYPVEFEPDMVPGHYRLYFGFYRNKKRLDVTQGNHDDNRLIGGNFDIQ